MMTDRNESPVEAAVMPAPQPESSRRFDLEGIRTRVRGQAPEPSGDVGDR